MGLRPRFSVLKRGLRTFFFCSGFESFDFTMPSDIGSFGSYTFCQQPLGARKMTVVNYDFSPSLDCYGQTASDKGREMVNIKKSSE